jgi:hypothetical protein
MVKIVKPINFFGIIRFCLVQELNPEGTKFAFG